MSDTLTPLCNNAAGAVRVPLHCCLPRMGKILLRLECLLAQKISPFRFATGEMTRSKSYHSTVNFSLRYEIDSSPLERGKPKIWLYRLLAQKILRLCYAPLRMIYWWQQDKKWYFTVACHLVQGDSSVANAPSRMTTVSDKKWYNGCTQSSGVCVILERQRRIPSDTGNT
jgi:hypothetical protein